MSERDTKSTILDAAEALFGEQGYAATSLRQLTTAARVNLAAVHYHFGSKEDLAKAVLARRIEPINAERLRRLACVPKPADVEAIVRAFVEPPLRSASSETAGAQQPTNQPGKRARAREPVPAQGFCRVFGRISVEQPAFLREFLTAQFRAVAEHFTRALQHAVPEQTAPTLWWRLHFVIGAMAHTLQNSAALSRLSDELCDPGDVDEIVEQLVAFAVGGMRTPAPSPTKPSRRAPSRRAPQKGRPQPTRR